MHSIHRAAHAMSVLDEELIKVANLFGGEDAVTVVNSLKAIGEGTDETITNDCKTVQQRSQVEHC